MDRLHGRTLLRGALAALALCGGLALSLEVALDRAAARLDAPALEWPHARALYGEGGALLNLALSSDQAWRLPYEAAPAPDDFIAMLLAYEDKRFFEHDGVDRRAVLRAGAQALRYAEVVSGGSTITMQLARLIERPPRTLKGKWRQMALARALERAHDKPALLAAYLERAPYGGNIEGIGAASLLYFGRKPQALSLAEKALMIALPQAPEARRPDLAPKAAFAARNAVLERLAAQGAIPHTAALAAQQEPLTAERRPPPAAARRLADLLAVTQPNAQRIDTFIDPALQRRASTLAQRSAPDQGQAAMIVTRLSDGAVRAYVGGVPDLEAPGGALDMLLARRSPGSTLKPFIYAMAYERGLAHPMTIARDAPFAIGGYGPRNFDSVHRGDLTLRSALRQSVNTIAVKLAAEVGPERIVRRLSRIGDGLTWDGGPPGLAVTLGGCAIRPVDLLRLYMALGSSGVAAPLRFRAGDAPGPRRGLLRPDAAWAVTDSLAGAPPPPGRLSMESRYGGRRIAFKTGTSYGGRDAWAVGYDLEHAVLVWIGRPDGAPAPELLGLHDAAPALFDLFAALPLPDGDVAGEAPAGSPLAPRETLPPGWRRLEGETGARLAILEPEDGAVLIAPPEAGFPLIASGGAPPYSWLADGRPLPAQLSETAYSPEGAGAVELSVIDASGASASVRVWIDSSSD